MNREKAKAKGKGKEKQEKGKWKGNRKKEKEETKKEKTPATYFFITTSKELSGFYFLEIRGKNMTNPPKLL